MGVLAATTAAVGLLAGPALASPPSEEPLAGVSITCGGDVLTFTCGVQVGDLHQSNSGDSSATRRSELGMASLRVPMSPAKERDCYPHIG